MFEPGRCYLYLRLSRDEEHDPQILNNHRALLLRTFAADGLMVPAENIYAEIGSGELIEARPEFQRLLAAWARLPHLAGGVVGVVEISRLSRGSFSQQGRVHDALTRAGILIRTPSRYYDLTLFEDRFSLNAQGLVSNAEHELFKQRVRRAWDEMLRVGEIRNGQAPWGYEWSKDEQNLQPHPLRFVLLQQFCRLALTQSVKGLARQFGVPETSVLAALRNPTICGWPAVRHGPTGRLDPDGRKEYRLLARSAWRWPEQQSTRYAHACTREQWEELQQVLDARYSRRSKTGGTEGYCRDVVSFVGAPGPARCGSYAVPGHHRLLYEIVPPARPKLYIDRAVVHRAAIDALAVVFASPAVLQAAVAAHRRADADRPEARATIADLIAERDRHERHLVQLLERELDATRPEELRRIGALRNEKELLSDRLTLQIEALAQHPAPAEAALSVTEAAVRGGLPFADWWVLIPEPDRRLVVRGFFETIEVTVTPGGRRHRREVTALRLREWLLAYVGEIDHG